MKHILKVLKPDTLIPLVFDSPHSGTFYPEDFKHTCDRTLLESAEDKYIDEIYAFAPDIGAPLLCAQFPRSYIDTNRGSLDIDEKLLSEPWPDDIKPSVRSHAGIGLIHRLARPGVPIYERTLSTKEVRRRIDTYYRPYHEALEKLLNEAYETYGQVWHINCHSMQSRSAFTARSAFTRNRAAIDRQTFERPDFILGDRDATSCDPNFTYAIRDFLKKMGYSVAINDPYKGVELVRRYSNPAAGRHSLQIEICKSLYMDENTFDKTPSFGPFKKDIQKLIQFCADYIEDQLSCQTTAN